MAKKNSDDKNDTSVSSQFSGLSMKALIGAPLKAAADANAMLARSQTQFIVGSCFDRDESGHLHPKMIQFHLERDVLLPDGTVSEKKARMAFSIPVMTLIPLRNIAINEMDISFEMEVHTSRVINHETHDDKKKSASSGFDGSSNADKFDCEMYGTLSKSSSGNSEVTNNARYDIKLKAQEGQLPLGVTAIIDAFLKNVAPVQTKK